MALESKSDPKPLMATLAPHSNRIGLAANLDGWAASGVKPVEGLPLRIARVSAEIAERLELRVKTVESQLRRLFDRYDVASRTALVRLAARQGWIAADRAPDDEVRRIYLGTEFRLD